MTTWFTSDLHFGHARILEYCARPWSTVAEMNAGLIERWNACVTPEDIVWVLGDVAMGQIAETLPLVEQLAGEKHLIPGNHDRVAIEYYGGSPKGPAKVAEWRERYEAVGFIIEPAEVVLGPGLKACHYPYEGDHADEERYGESRPLDAGGWLLHGHVHDAWRQRGRQINVGADVWNWAPVERRVLVNLMVAATAATTRA